MLSFFNLDIAIILLWITIAVIIYVLIYQSKQRLFRTKRNELIPDYKGKKHYISLISPTTENPNNRYKVTVKEYEYWIIFFGTMFIVLIIGLFILPKMLILPLMVITSLLTPYNFKFRKERSQRVMNTQNITLYLNALASKGKQGLSVLEILNDLQNDNSLHEPFLTDTKQVYFLLKNDVPLRTALETLEEKYEKNHYVKLAHQILLSSNKNKPLSKRQQKQLLTIATDYEKLVAKKNLYESNILKKRKTFNIVMLSIFIVVLIAIPIISNFTTLGETTESHRVVALIILFSLVYSIHQTEKVVNKVFFE